MSETNPSARPRQLTMAGWVVVGGSLFVLLSAFDTLSTLTSVDTREDIVTFLDTPMGQALGISVTEATDAMRVGLNVVAVCAAAAAVLGFFVLRRHLGARRVLSLVVIPLPFAIFVPGAGGLVGVLVAAAVAVLWTGPARDWFAGRPVREWPVVRPHRPVGDSQAPRPPGPPTTPGQEPSGRETSGQEPSGPDDGSGSQRPVTPTVSSLSTSGASTQPVATRGFGDQPAPSSQAWQQQWVGTGVPSLTPTMPPRPGPVQVACYLTWIFSGVVALAYAVMMVILVVAKDEIVDYVVKLPQWEQANLDAGVLVPVLWLGCLMFFGWAVGACLLAFFTWRRHDWARYLLAASAGAALVAATFAFPVGIPHQVVCAVTIGTLFSAKSRAWFAAPSTGARRPPPGPPPPPTGGWPPQDTPSPPTSSAPGDGKPPVW